MDPFRSNDDEHQLNIGTVSNPTYEQTIIQSTQSNSNYQGRDITETPYSIPVKVKFNTLTNTCALQVNDTNSSNSSVSNLTIFTLRFSFVTNQLLITLAS